MSGSAIAYFFKKDKYLRYNIAQDLVDVGGDGHTEIKTYWPKLPTEFQSGFDAAVNWGNGYAYFFKKDKYLRYNIAQDLVDVGGDGHTEIKTYWPKLPTEFQSGFDAAVNWGNGYAYFFKKDKYLRYNIAQDLVDVGGDGHTEIKTYWPKLPTEFQSGFDAAVNWGNGYAYFFKKDKYLRYNIAQDLVDVGGDGHTEIKTYWPKLPTEFQSGFDAAVNWTFPLNVADLMREQD